MAVSVRRPGHRRRWTGDNTIVVLLIYRRFCSLLRMHCPDLHGPSLEPFGESRSNFGRQYGHAAIKRALPPYVEDSKGASYLDEIPTKRFGLRLLVLCWPLVALLQTLRFTGITTHQGYLFGLE